MKITKVGYAEEAQRVVAQELAEQLDYQLDKEADSCLFVSADKVSLKMPSFSLLAADFTAATWSKRRAEGKKQGLIRACKPTPGMRIIDATAGWGRDSAVLASFGADVLMIERHPVMSVLLTDALAHRVLLDEQSLSLSLHQGDAYSYFEALSPDRYPDVIYIDPMHPERTKSALVKKDMQVLQQMIGADEDVLALIKMAVTRVKQRVVVKWPQKSAALLKANSCIEGKTVRFDIYTAVIL